MYFSLTEPTEEYTEKLSKSFRALFGGFCDFRETRLWLTEDLLPDGNVFIESAF